MTDTPMPEAQRTLMRHMVATLAYRGGKVLRDAPEGFGEFLTTGALNTPVALVAHLADLLEWAARWCRGSEDTYVISEPKSWTDEVARFHASLAALDATLESPAPVLAPFERMFQAPIADALTHIGQLALLRRLAGAPVLGESYRRAEIVAGRVGAQQAPAGREFPPGKGAVWHRPRVPTSD
jgi:hypothetical protein